MLPLFDSLNSNRFHNCYEKSTKGNEFCLQRLQQSAEQKTLYMIWAVVLYRFPLYPAHVLRMYKLFFFGWPLVNFVISPFWSEMAYDCRYEGCQPSWVSLSVVMPLPRFHLIFVTCFQRLILPFKKKKVLSSSIGAHSRVWNVPLLVQKWWRKIRSTH